jgi:O-antigen ligase
MANFPGVLALPRWRFTAIRRLVIRTSAWCRRMARRISAPSPEIVFLFALLVLLVAFAATLLFQPTVGRGGR